MDKGSKIFIAGKNTLTGGALVRKLAEEGYANLYDELGSNADLTDPVEVDRAFSSISPDYVFLAAGKSGGISANLKYPADLIRDNLQVITNVIHYSYMRGVKKLVYMASSCCYPRECPQPIREEYLLTGPFEPTNDAYSAAKVAGIKMCQAYNKQYGTNFVSVIPPNFFGPGDDFHPENSHVVAALIRKMHEAKMREEEMVEIWGTGNPRREFVYVDDIADAAIFIMDRYNDSEPINAGGGSDLSIREMAMQIKEAVGYRGELRFNTSQPDGMPVKLLDSSKLMKRGWKPKTSIKSALLNTYNWYLQEQKNTAQSGK